MSASAFPTHTTSLARHMTPAGASISGCLMPDSGAILRPTRFVTGVWFGSIAVPAGQPLSGLHGELQVERNGQFRYRARRSLSQRHVLTAGPIEEHFTVNLSDTAGTSCVGELSISIQATPTGPELSALFRLQSTVTERYCLTAQNGLALLCMETGEHFEICRVDTPLSAVARTHDREFFGVGGQHLLRIDPVNGNTVWIGILAQARRIVALDGGPDGFLYGIDVQGDLYRIQPSNGVTTLLVRLALPSLFRGALTHMDNRLLWTAADNRLHCYDLQSAEHSVVLEAMQPAIPDTLHERVLAMMASMDGALFLATERGVLRVNPVTGGCVDLGLRSRLGELMGPGIPPGPQWGGREPGTEEAMLAWKSDRSAAQTH